MTYRTRLKRVEEFVDERFGPAYVREAISTNCVTGEMPTHRRTAEFIKLWRLSLIGIEMSTFGGTSEEIARSLPFEPTTEEWEEMEADAARRVAAQKTT